MRKLVYISTRFFFAFDCNFNTLTFLNVYNWRFSGTTQHTRYKLIIALQFIYTSTYAAIGKEKKCTPTQPSSVTYLDQWIKKAPAFNVSHRL